MGKEEWTDVPVSHGDETWTDVDDSKISSPSKHSALASGVMHGLQGATGGFMDELQGAGEVAGRAVGVKGAGGPMKDMGIAPGGPTLDWETLRDAYKAARDHERKTLTEQEKEHDVASGVGTLTGMVASPLNKLTSGLSLAKGGAVLGGVNGLGSSDAEDIGGMAKDTAFGTGAGLVLGKGIDKASPILEKGVEKVAGGARSLAKRFGARALGAERGTIKSLGIDKVEDAAGQMLDEGGFRPFSNTEDLIARNAALKDKGGEMMGKAYAAIDDAGASTFHPHDVAEEVENKLGNVWRTPINKGEVNQLDNTIESILERGPGDIPLSEAQALKEELGHAANWKNKLTVTPKEQMARDAYGIVNDKIDEAVNLGGGVVDQAGLSDTLATGKKLYGNAKTGETLLDNKLAREQGNKIMSLDNLLSGGTALGYGETTGDWKGAGGFFAGKKLLQKYGAQNAALGLNKISKMLMRTPRFAQLAEKSPQAFNALAASFARRMEGGALPKAAEQQPPDDDSAKKAYIEGN